MSIKAIQKPQTFYIIIKYFGKTHADYYTAYIINRLLGYCLIEDCAIDIIFIFIFL